jgi:hypothetical protein
VKPDFPKLEYKDYLWSVKDRTKNILELKECVLNGDENLKRQAKAIMKMLKAGDLEDADIALREVLNTC